LQVGSAVSRSQEIEFAAWAIGRAPLDENIICVFPEDNQQVQFVIFHHRGGTETLVSGRFGNTKTVTEPLPLEEIMEKGKPHRQ
jgi:hypothetical protein